MLRVFLEVYNSGLASADVAERADIDPATLSRIIHGKQKPGYGKGGSAERIAQAIGYDGDPADLFEDIEVSQ